MRGASSRSSTPEKAGASTVDILLKNRLVFRTRAQVAAKDRQAHTQVLLVHCLNSRMKLFGNILFLSIGGPKAKGFVLYRVQVNAVHPRGILQEFSRELFLEMYRF